MSFFKKLMEKQWFAYTLASCSAVLLFMLLSRIQDIMDGVRAIWSFISPVVIGIAVAYLLNPIACFLERKMEKKIKRERIRHALAVAGAVILTILTLVLILVAVVPSVVSNIVTLINNTDSYIRSVDRFFSNADNLMHGTSFNIVDLVKTLEEVLKKLLSIIPRSLGTIVKTSVSVGFYVANGMIGFIIAIYFLLDKKRILSSVKRLRHALLSDKVYQRNTDFIKRCDYIFMQYISCNLLDGLIIGCANAVFMLVFGIPYVALLSVLVGITNLLPTFGPIVGAVIGAFILVINTPIMALWFIIFCIVIQILDAYVIKPKLFGASLGMPAVLTLISIILGGKLFGVLGVFLAIPVVSVLLTLYDESLLPWLESRK